MKLLRDFDKCIEDYTVKAGSVYGSRSHMTENMSFVLKCDRQITWLTKTFFFLVIWKSITTKS